MTSQASYRQCHRQMPFTEEHTNESTSLQVVAKVIAHHTQVLSLKPNTTTIISTAISDKGRRKMELYHSPADQESSRQLRPETVWKANYDEPVGHASEKRTTYMLPLDLEQIILGFSESVFPKRRPSCPSSSFQVMAPSASRRTVE